MYTLYILKCSDGSLYTGVAKDLNKRILDHEKGLGSKYVRSRLPVQVVYTEEFPNRSTAQKREAEIKKLSRNEKLVLVSK